MAVVVVQVGQCGNQLGDELFSQLAIITNTINHAPRTASPFFTKDGKARCVLIDTEPKVVQGVHERHKSFIRSDNVIFGQSGRGNNWGLGYYGNEAVHHFSKQRTCTTNTLEFSSNDNDMHHAFHNLGKDQRVMDSSVLQRALRAIHLETRRTDDAPWFEAIVLIHSLAGGTGSGLASHLAEKLRFYFVEPRCGEAPVDELQEHRAQCQDGIDGLVVEKRRARYLISITVAPQASGEVATQGFNVALTLNVLLRTVDAVLLLRNDDVLQAEPCNVLNTKGEEDKEQQSPSGKSTNLHSHTESSRSRFYSNRNCVNSSNSLIHRCITFKEANEVFIGLLLPLFNYGLAINTDVQPSQTNKVAANNKRSKNNAHQSSSSVKTRCREALEEYEEEYYGYQQIREEEQEEGVIGKLITQCIRKQNSDNIILTLLPTPQRSYARFRSVAFCGTFYVLHGNKEHMPGYSPQIPTQTLLLQSLTHAQHEQEELQMESTHRGNKINRSRLERPPWQSTWHNKEDEEEEEEEEEHENVNRKRGGANTSSDCMEEYLVEEHVNVPPALLCYYNSHELRQSPVSKLYTQLEGVCVLNQVKELDQALLFSLLRSAALKVKLGAFLGPYVEIGVTAERITEAYQNVAKVLSDAEANERNEE